MCERMQPIVEIDQFTLVKFRQLGIRLDSDLSMNMHVTRTVSCCFAVLRQIRSNSRSVSQPVVQSLIASLVISRLDYGSAMLVGLPAFQIDRLQSASYSAARLIYGFGKFYHVTPLLHDIHWLRIPERITFRLAVLAYHCQNGLVPQYLASPGGGGRVTATAAFGGDCGTDRPSHGASCNRRSRFLCRCRAGVEQPSALGDVISVPSGFPKTS